MDKKLICTICGKDNTEIRSSSRTVGHGEVSNDTHLYCLNPNCRAIITFENWNHVFDEKKYEARKKA